MSGIVDLFLKAGRHLGVDGSGSERAMAEQQLDRLKIHPIFEPMGSDGVADCVRGDFAS
jgi:hypothetical protein